MMHEKVLADIEAERVRQREVEGWTDAHDDVYVKGELAEAAGCYAEVGAASDRRRRDFHKWLIPDRWPWSAKWWKPTERRRDLVKAAALIVAEIERLDRIEIIKEKAVKLEDAKAKVIVAAIKWEEADAAWLAVEAAATADPPADVFQSRTIAATAWRTNLDTLRKSITQMRELM